MYISRSMEQALLERVKNSRCIMVTGTRQVGKSTLLKTLFPNVRYVTLRESLAKKVLLGVIQRAKRVSSVG